MISRSQIAALERSVNKILRCHKCHLSHLSTLLKIE